MGIVEQKTGRLVKTFSVVKVAWSTFNSYDYLSSYPYSPSMPQLSVYKTLASVISLKKKKTKTKTGALFSEIAFLEKIKFAMMLRVHNHFTLFYVISGWVRATACLRWPPHKFTKACLHVLQFSHLCSTVSQPYD